MPYDDIFDLSLDASVEDLERLDKSAEKAQKKWEKSMQDREKVKKLFTKIGNRQDKIQGRLGKTRETITKKQDKTIQDIRDNHEKQVGALNKLEAAVRSKQDREIERIFRDRKKRYRAVETDKKKWQSSEERERRSFDKIIRGMINRRKDDRTFMQKIFGGSISSNPRVALKLFQNPLGFFYSMMAVIPFLGGIIAAKDMAMFVWKELVKIDAFYKKFIDMADNRVSIFRNREDEALLRTGKKQFISTTQSGSIDPRESYNSYEEFNTNRADVENRFATRNISGVP